MNIVLVGFMGSGKSAVGKILAGRLNMRFIDLDSEIEKDLGLTITEIFKKNGEEYFRSVETRIIRLFSLLDNQVIATGGGVVLKDENITELKRTGCIFYLSATPETVYRRIKEEVHRPLLAGKKGDEALSEIKKILSFRREMYEKSGTEIKTDGQSSEEVAAEIEKHL